MATTSIIIDNTEMDFIDSQSFPLSLSKQTDNLLKIIGATGSEIDNSAKSITLPPTKKNNKLYQHPSLLHTVPSGLQRLPTKILANSVPIFSGDSILSKGKSNIQPSQLVLELLGDGISIWDKLADLSLRDLDLGTLTWSETGIRTSWISTPQTGGRAIFAPIIYGKTSGQEPGSWHPRDFRPAIYFDLILRSIIETHLGYTIESEFFESEFWYRCVYLFGVGDQIEYDSQPTWCYVDAYRVPGVNTPISPLSFTIENQDECGEWDGTDTFTASKTTSYTIRFQATGSENFNRLELFKNGVIDTFFPPTSAPPGSGTTWDITHSINLNVGDTLQLHAVNDVGGPNVFVIVATLIIHEPQPQPHEGFNIILSSCLHNKPAKDFIRAITYMFGLGWNVNNSIRKVYCEPRFDYKFSFGTNPTTHHPGFYRSPDSPLTNIRQISQSEFSFEYPDPFGRSLTLTHIQDSSDPLNDLYTGSSSELSLPILSTKQTLQDLGKDGTTETNPLFSNLLLGRADPTLVQGGVLPCVLPSSHELTDETLPSLDKRTFKSDPKCGLIFREALTAEFDGATFQEEDMPFVSMYKPYDIPSSPQDDSRNSLIFADMETINTSDPNYTMKGLSSTFFLQYFSTLKPAIIVKLSSPYSFTQFSTEQFRDLRRLELNNESILSILYKMGGMKPATPSPLLFEFLIWRQATQKEMDDLTHNTISTPPPFVHA